MPDNNSTPHQETMFYVDPKLDADKLSERWNRTLGLIVDKFKELNIPKDKIEVLQIKALLQELQFTFACSLAVIGVFKMFDNGSVYKAVFRATEDQSHQPDGDSAQPTEPTP